MQKPFIAQWHTSIVYTIKEEVTHVQVWLKTSGFPPLHQSSKVNVKQWNRVLNICFCDYVTYWAVKRVFPFYMHQSGVTMLYALFFQGWGMYAQLLIDLFKFLAPFLRNVELSKPTHFLYKVWYELTWRFYSWCVSV